LLDRLGGLFRHVVVRLCVGIAVRLYAVLDVSPP
jgi:hypothetical protein